MDEEIRFPQSDLAIAKKKKADKKRDNDLQKSGLTVLRYSNNQINKYFEDVCNDISKQFDLSVNELK